MIRPMTSAWLVVASLLVTACSGLGQKATPTAEPAVDQDLIPLVNATGIVVPGRYSNLSMSAGGVVAEVLVQENELVKEGQPLVRLEGQENLQAAVAMARLEMAAAQYELDQLYKNPELRAAEAQRAVVEWREALRDANRFSTNLYTAASQNDIDQARANLAIARDHLDKAREDYEPYEKKPEDNPVRAAFLSKKAQAEKDYENAARKLNNLLGGANDLDEAKAEADLVLAQARLDTAEQDYEIFQNGPRPEDVRLAEERLANARAQLAASEAALSYLELVAPFDGVVSELYMRQNEWIAPGLPVLLLADLGDLRVETTDLSEIDVARLEVGAPVIVTFDALPDVRVDGSVTWIAPKSSQGSGVNYKVLVKLAQIPEKLRWGMTAFVDIEVGE